MPQSDALYGLGQFPDGVLNWRGQTATLIHGNISIAIPMIVSTGGWGVMWHNASHTDFHDNAEGMHLKSEVADCLDYVLFLGQNFDEIIAGYRGLTGHAPCSPRASMVLSSVKNAIKPPKK